MKFTFYISFFLFALPSSAQNTNLIREKSFFLQYCDDLKTSWNSKISKDYFVSYYHSYRYSRCWVYGSEDRPYEGYFILQLSVDTFHDNLKNPSLHIELCKAPKVGETYYLGFALENGGDLRRIHKRNPIKIGFTNDSTQFDAEVKWQPFNRFHKGNGVYSIPVEASENSKYLRMEFKKRYSWVSYNIDSISISSPKDMGCSDWFLGNYTTCLDNECVTEIELKKEIVQKWDTTEVKFYLDSLYQELGRVRFSKLQVIVKDWDKDELTYSYIGRKKANFVSSYLNTKKHCGAEWSIQDLLYNVKADKEKDNQFRLFLRFEYPYLNYPD